MAKFIPIVVAAVVIVIGTFDQGRWTERWGKRDSQELNSFTDRLKLVPTVIGDWEGVNKEVDQKQFQASNCDGYVSRDFTNRITGESVSVFLVSGFGRHITMHDPTWCYQGAGYEMDLRGAVQYSFKVDGVNPAPEALTSTFTKSDETGQHRLRIFWTYSDDGNWQGPASATSVFGVRPAVYKVYFITNAANRRDSPDDSQTVKFAQQFFPAINKILFPPEVEATSELATGAVPESQS